MILEALEVLHVYNTRSRRMIPCHNTYYSLLFARDETYILRRESCPARLNG
jgi:hypothetical protein